MTEIWKDNRWQPIADAECKTPQSDAECKTPQSDEAQDEAASTEENQRELTMRLGVPMRGSVAEESYGLRPKPKPKSSLQIQRRILQAQRDQQAKRVRQAEARRTQAALQNQAEASTPEGVHAGATVSEDATGGRIYEPPEGWRQQPKYTYMAGKGSGRTSTASSTTVTT